jgi:hypothetical protein
VSAALLSTLWVGVVLPLTVAALSLMTLKRFDAIATRKSRRIGARQSDDV